ncbi:hypothetical protein DLH48_09515, partial [Neisseria gonorrhoeae]
AGMGKHQDGGIKRGMAENLPFQSFIHRISFSVKPPALRGGRIRLCPGGVQALPNQGGALCAALRVGTYFIP